MPLKLTVELSEPREADLREAAPRLFGLLFPQIEFMKTEGPVRLGSVVIDWKARVRVGGVQKTVLAEFKSKGEPKYLWNAVGRLLLAKEKVKDAYPMVIVPSLSDEGRAILQQANIGYLTFEGEAYMSVGGVYVEKQPASTPLRKEAAARLKVARKRRQFRKFTASIEQLLRGKKRVPKLGFPYSSKASRVLRVLLENPDRSWTVASLAKEARVAPRLALLVVNNLDSKEYVKKQRGDTRLVRAKELLETWATIYEFRTANRFRFYYSLARTFDDFASKLRDLPENTRDAYRLTLFSGASLIAPQIRFDQTHLFFSGDADAWVASLDLREVTSGANVILVEPYDEGVFDYGQKKNGLWVSSNTQLFLDLYQYNERAREQAEFLYEQVMVRGKAT